MTKGKQLNEELVQTIDELKTIYGFTYSALSVQLKYEKDKNILAEVVDKALQWDIFKARCGTGGKVGSSNLTKKQRIDRAKRANTAKALKAQKEKERKHQNQINKHRI